MTAAVITDDGERVYPLKRPQGWAPKLPRWTLQLPDDVNELAVVYIGVQRHNESSNVQSAIAAVEKLVTNADATQVPLIVDRFEVLSGRDSIGSAVWTCYFINTASATSFEASLQLVSLHASLDPSTRSSIGIWLESFHPTLSRFETNYSGPDYQPGLAQLHGTQQLPHNLTGYWGAARDRIPSSAYDKFDADNKDAPWTERSTDVPAPDFNVPSVNARVRGSNQQTIAHIRSGQFWENCNEVEREAYETNLERHLRNGLDDIFAHPEEKGDFGLRFLRNVDSFPLHSPSPSSQPRRETCASGFFRSLADLEAWAKGCPSHHQIYGGSMTHRRRFGTEAKMRTWHEICVLKPGEARWEYVNCIPGTGTIAFQASEVHRL